MSPKHPADYLVRRVFSIDQKTVQRPTKKKGPANCRAFFDIAKDGRLVAVPWAAAIFCQLALYLARD